MYQQRKNIVIVGLGAVAINLGRALERDLPSTHRIVIITESDVGQYRSSLVNFGFTLVSVGV